MMRAVRSGLLATSAVFAVAAMSPVPAFAQSSGDVESVTVTASKFSERQIDVPIPVAVVTAESLVVTNSVHLEDYATKIPGLDVTAQGNGRTSAIIRGISTGFGDNPTVGITIDDVPIGSSTSAGIGDSIIPDLDPSVLQSVEVLRGPQGSLYGASSMGGLIRYVTVAPSLDELSGEASASVTGVAHGGVGDGVRGAVNVPVVSDQLAVQASAFYRIDPGYVDNIRNNQKDANISRSSGGRLALLWQIAPKVSFELSGLMQTRKADGATRVDVSFYRAPLNGNYYSLDRLPKTGIGDLNIGIYSATLKADLGFADLTSISAYSRSAFNGPQDVAGSFDRYLGYIYPASVVPTLSSGILNYAQTNKFSQEVRLASKQGSEFEWMLGGFFTHEASLSDQTIYAANRNTGEFYDTDWLYTVHDPAGYTEYAAFGSATYHFTPALDLQVGARISALHQFYSDTVGGVLNGETDFTVGEASANVFTWSITPRYHISDDMMVYARVATGYRPGGPNSAPNEPTSYGPDRTTNYEIGFKGIVIPSLLTVDASIFNIDWSHIQLEAASPTNFNFIENGGSANSKGAELAVYLTPSEGLTIAANFAYVEATLSSDIAVSSLYGLAGQRLPYSSKTAGSLSADQRFPLTEDFTGSVGATFNYVGSRYAAFPTSATNARFFMPAYGTLDLRAGIEHDTWDLSFFVRNVCDQVAFTYGQSRNVATRAGNYDASIITPRLTGLSLTKKF